MAPAKKGRPRPKANPAGVNSARKPQQQFPNLYSVHTSLLSRHHHPRQAWFQNRLHHCDEALGLQIDAPAKDGEANAALLDYIRS
ncbi:hypothetical protein GBA52_028502, partial [Prunus armeniaca]